MFRALKSAAAVVATAGLLVAQPAMAAAKSTSVDRAGSAVGEAEDFAGTPMIGILIALGVVIAVALIIAGDDDDDEEPVSP